MDRHRAAPSVLKPPPHRRPPSQDLRAPRRLHVRDILTWSTQRGLALMAGDILALAVSWYLARSLNRQFSPIPSQLVWWTWLGKPSLFWIMVAYTLGLFTYAGLYQSSRQVKNYLRAGKLVSFAYLTALVAMYFYDPKLDLPRSLFFSAWLSSVGFVVVARVVMVLALRPLEKARNPSRVFLIAPAQRIKALADILHQRAKVPVIGAALASTANSNATYQAILASQATVVLAESIPSADLASELYWKLRRVGLPLQLIPTSRDMLYRRGNPETLAGLPTLHLDAPPVGGWDYRLKRGLDYLGAGLGVFILAPVFLVIALAIRLDSPGPAFFRQERVGLHGKPFQVWKFRTMTADAPQQQAQLEQQNETADGILFKVKHDPRVTRVGAVLRRTSLDELPQLFNVLWGQMSLVGPRPLPLRDVAKFDGWHNIRHQVLPGVTGLWQISGRSDIDTFDDVARLDLHYIDNWSINLDLEILAATVGIVFFGKGAY
ncbi:MAG: sugar transferase [Leptolyngbya sp.]|nr:sugar transferase [Leptolyngbya sp.]